MGPATTLRNTLEGSHPAFVALDVALFDPERRLVATPRLHLHRGEDGVLVRSFDSNLPHDGYLVRDANANTMVIPGSDSRNPMTVLPRTLGSSAPEFFRQALDDGAWVVAWMTRDVALDLPIPVLLRWAGKQNDIAIEHALSGDVDEAIRIWKTLDTASSRIAFNLGIAYGVRGDERNSARYFEAAERGRSRRMSRNFLAGARARQTWRERPRSHAWCDPARGP